MTESVGDDIRESQSTHKDMDNDLQIKTEELEASKDATNVRVEESKEQAKQNPSKEMEIKSKDSYDTPTEATEEDHIFPESPPAQEAKNSRFNSGDANQADTRVPFPVTSTQKLLVVPLASEWQEGMIIRDHGEFVAKVLCHEKLGRLRSGVSVYRATLCDENNEITAVITRRMKAMENGGKEYYEISNAIPSYPGQESHPYVYMGHDPNNRGKQIVRTMPIYPFAKLYQSTLGGIHELRSCQDGNAIIMQAKNQDIKCMVICCPVALITTPYLWMFEFYRDPRRSRRWSRHGKEPAIARDQGSQQLLVAAGESMLLAICVSYAVDRFTTRMC